MKIKHLLPLAALAFFTLSGCRENSYSLVLPESVKSGSVKPESIPQQVEYQGESYHLAKWNGQNGEYYRSGEQGYAWQKLITLSRISDGVTLSDFEQAMKHQLVQEKALHEVSLQGDVLSFTMLYAPQADNPNFADYESNVMRYQALPCGIAGMQYAEKHDKNSNPQQLFAQAKQKQQAFQAQAATVLAGINCR